VQLPILVAVDDEQENLDLVGRTLSGTYDVRPFTDPREAAAEARDLDPAVLVLDYRMAHLSGIDLLAELRDRGVTAPAVIVTGFADARELGPEARQRLDFRIVPKPWRPPDPRTAVQLAVSLHRMEVAQRALKH
jgi:FixJ family two-component response regulator